jgi:N6-L-threonylcarbamoyladenine synthase
MIKTLAIETSCDDTSIAIVHFDGSTFQIEDMKYYSQIKEHTKYGGVVPEIASRLHQEKIVGLIEEIGIEKIKNEIDFITVTAEPGLP